MLSSESFHNASKPRLSAPRQRPEGFAGPDEFLLRNTNLSEKLACAEYKKGRAPCGDCWLRS